MSYAVDLRKFKYQLMPLLKQANWKLDALQLDLGRARQLYEQCQCELVEQENQLKAQLLKIRDAWNEKLNIVNHRHGLFFVQDMQIKIDQKRKELSEKQAELALILEKCIAQQRRVELLENHQKELKAVFVTEQTNLLSAEIDRDWNARSSCKNLRRDIVDENII